MLAMSTPAMTRRGCGRMAKVVPVRASNARSTQRDDVSGRNQDRVVSVDPGRRETRTTSFISICRRFSGSPWRLRRRGACRVLPDFNRGIVLTPFYLNAVPLEVKRFQSCRPFNHGMRRRKPVLRLKETVEAGEFLLAAKPCSVLFRKE